MTTGPSGSGRVLAVLLAAVLLAGPLAGAADAVPPPPRDPGDAALDRSRAAVSARAAEVGALTARLADLDARTDDLQADLAARREDAEDALEDLTAARAAAAEATRRADDAQVATDAAGRAVDDARARLDAFVAATWSDGLDAGPFGLLTGAEDPADLVDRATFTDVVARAEATARDGLERARVARVNAESLARAAQGEAVARRDGAAAAERTAAAALGVADAAAREQARRLADLDRQRADVQARLDAAEATDAALHTQRERFRAWQRQLAAERAARARAARDAAAGRSARPRVPAAPGARGTVAQVIDRALSQVGVQYVWGGGTGRGPSTGLGTSRVGFDCSGLMLYAYGGAGVPLPRTSRRQFGAGRTVPITELRPGDLVFYQRPGGPIHHVAMYVGGGDMVEAPYTGADVRVVPLRRAGLVPRATRLL